MARAAAAAAHRPAPRSLRLGGADPAPRRSAADARALTNGARRGGAQGDRVARRRDARWCREALAVALVAAAAGSAPASPAPTPPAGPAAPTPAPAAPGGAAPSAPPARPASASKDDARALLASGVRLLQAQDYLGALAVFRDAYQRFPSARLLLNIGTTLRLLGRSAEAANTYQRYLGAPDVDPARRDEVARAIEALDRETGSIALSLTPADAAAEIQVGAAREPAVGPRHRVPPGAVTVRARRAGYAIADRTVEVAAGEVVAIALELDPIPEALEPPPEVILARDAPAPTGAPSAARLGVIGMVRVPVGLEGAAGLLGLALALHPRAQLVIAGLRTPGEWGAYGGATASLLDGRVRPTLSLGAAVIASNGAQPQLRGAGGLEIRLGRRAALIGELGIEYTPDPERTAELAIRRFATVIGVGTVVRR